MSTTVTLIPGDGIGPEVTEAAVRVIEAAGADVDWEPVEAGLEAIPQYGKPLPDQVLESIQRNKVALKGPLTTMIARGFGSANVELRKTLDLYANLRPVRNVPGLQARYDHVDLVVVRENTEDLYAGLEHIVAPGVTESLKIITRPASRRIAQFAFDYARGRGRAKVTAVHKANIMKLTDGLFLECAREVAQAYPDVAYEEVIVDSLCMQLVMDPQKFDVLLLGNLYGDIVSDLCAGLVGGLGVVPGANLGDECAVFEAVHGSAPDIAGKGIANPLAMLLSGALMLDHLGQYEAAARIRKGIVEAMARPENRTPDLGGPATTAQMTEAILAGLN